MSKDERIDYIRPGRGYKFILAPDEPYLFVRCDVSDSHTDVCLVDAAIDPHSLTATNLDKVPGVQKLAEVKDDGEPVDVASLGVPVPKEFVILSHFQTENRL